jgi:hypothetical protein
MTPEPTPDAPELLRRAQLLHDATLRRHGEMLDRHTDALARHDEALVRHHSQIAALRTLAEAQDATLHQVVALQAQLTTTLQALKDLLERRNGH